MFRIEILYCFFGLSPLVSKIFTLSPVHKNHKIIYSHNSFQILSYFAYWCHNNKSVILFKIYPLPERTVTLYFTGYSRRKHQAEHVKLLRFLKYVNYSCILDFIPHTTQASSSMLFRENKQTIACFWTTKYECSAYFCSHFASQEEKENLQFIAEVY